MTDLSNEALDRVQRELRQLMPACGTANRRVIMCMEEADAAITALRQQNAAAEAAALERAAVLILSLPPAAFQPGNASYIADALRDMITPDAAAALEAVKAEARREAVKVKPLVWDRGHLRDGTTFWKSDCGHIITARGDNQFQIDHMVFGLRADAIQWAQDAHEARIRAALAEKGGA